MDNENHEVTRQETEARPPRRRLLILAFVAAFAAASAGAYYTRCEWLPWVMAPFAKKVVTAGKEVYLCPMHPNVVRDHPADCPICGMALVKKEMGGDAAGGEDMAGHEGAQLEPGVVRVSLDPRQVALANVATSLVAENSLSQDITTVGRIAENERSIRRVTSRYGGRIERLAVNYTGQPVGKGQLLMSVYSPELIATQKEFLIAKESVARLKSADFPEISRGSEGVMQASRTRMRLWGMTDAQIDRLDGTGEVKDTIDIYSPYSGTVMEMKVRQGDYVMEGAEIFTLSDLSRVWMLAEVYEYEFSKVSLGSRVEVTAEAFPGRTFTGTVVFVEPVVDPESRTIRVRVELPNPGGRLKPEMFVNAKILSKATHALTIPASAVLYTGMADVVWVEVEPGTYERREVKLGLRSRDDYQVLSGLRAGEMVVTQGGFLIDSEAQLRHSAGGAMPGMEHGAPGGEPAPAPEAPAPMPEGGAMPPGHRH